MKKKSIHKELLNIAIETARIKGFDEGFDACKEMYSNYVILPKCHEYGCSRIGDKSYTHIFGTEHACEEHSDPERRVSP